MRSRTVPHRVRARRHNPPVGTTTYAGKPLAIFTGGLPGAGKSSYVKDMDFEGLGFTIVETDRFLEGHPNYDPKHPELLYLWAKRQAEQQLQDVLHDRVPFVYDGTAANVEKMVQHITDAQAAGFYTIVVFVNVPVDVALDRNRRRARSVPDEAIIERAEAIQTAARILADYADDIEIIDNLTEESRRSAIAKYDAVYRGRPAARGLGAPWRGEVRPNRRRPTIIDAAAD